MNKETLRVINLPTIVQRTEEWYATRHNLLTASDVPTVLGENKYKSKKTLLKQKLNLKKEIKITPSIQHGIDNENTAIEIYEEKYNDKCYETGLYVHPKYEWLGCSPDGVTYNGYLMEVKCPVYRKITNEVPSQYYGQIQVQLECMNMETCVFVQYMYKEHDIHVQYVKRDKEWFERNLQEMRDFWELVKKTRKKTMFI